MVMVKEEYTPLSPSGDNEQFGYPQGDDIRPKVLTICESWYRTLLSEWAYGCWDS
jgi:hypothetical protein